MIKHRKPSMTLPENKDFLIWVKRSLADLGMSPSQFLRDEGKPGSANRLNNIFRNPSALKLAIAKRLERELRASAAERGIELLPLPGGSFYQEAS